MIVLTPYKSYLFNHVECSIFFCDIFKVNEFIWIGKWNHDRQRHQDLANFFKHHVWGSNWDLPNQWEQD